MALDLFANFERASNSSSFYRTVSAVPFTISLKLSDLELPDEDLGTLYYAESSINGGPYSEFFAGIDGTFQTGLEFECSAACISSISVTISAAANLIGEFVLSAIFVDQLPVADFVAYPSSVIFSSDGVPAKLDLNSTNYQQTSGVWFYGEGHTEIINLSSSLTDNQLSAVWYIGNQLNQISESSTSNISVTSTGVTATVQISSELNQQEEYPISLFVASSSIPVPSVLLTYDDATGEAKYYPFFASTFVGENTLLKEPIRVLVYPSPTSIVLQNPFPGEVFSLPFDYSTESFVAALDLTRSTSVLTEVFKGSKWYLEGNTRTSSWETPGTDFLLNILAYQFNIGYDNNPNDVGGYLSLFKAAAIEDTNLTVTAHTTKEVLINLPPYDWPRKSYTQVLQAIGTVASIVFSKLYLPNFYNIKNAPVPILLVPLTDTNYNLLSVTVQSEDSPDTLTLTNSSLSGLMVFDKIGFADLSATVTLKDNNTNVIQQIGTILPRMLEVIDVYDDVDEDYFQTALTPIVISQSEAPKLSPNEWAIADNVNSIIEKLYNVIDDLNDYTKLYEPKNKFYGWIGAGGNVSEDTDPVYVWQDLECPSTTTDAPTWSEFELDGDGEVCSSGPLSWLYHDCFNAPDPTCFGKYCTEWSWKSRNCKDTETKITWKDAKCSGLFSKYWKYEPCGTDSIPVNCSFNTWKISTIDSEYFPIPSCSFSSRCGIVDVVVAQNNNLVVGYPTEIKLIGTDYNATYFARRGSADDLYSFQNIVGVAAGIEGRIFVLDGTLSRVSVFFIKNNRFDLFASWGDYGLVESPQGFNSPTDIHIDTENSLWIADNGNECVKKLTITGRNLMTLTSNYFKDNAPISVCVDSKKNLHCLTETGIYVFDSEGTFSFKYDLPEGVTDINKINTSYNREMIYVTYNLGVVKYFRTGVIANYLFDRYECASGQFLEGYNSMTQDKFRNVYITVGDKILKVPDLMHNIESKAPLSPDLYWELSDLQIHKEEYIQPWVYLKAFHRLWDNIEIFRSALFYEAEGCKSYKPPVYQKEDLVIGQNEIVTNSVINRLSSQLWTNIKTMFNYFDPDC
jgi:hypothetical protein